jgi:hypothetical protein
LNKFIVADSADLPAVLQPAITKNERKRKTKDADDFLFIILIADYSLRRLLTEFAMAAFMA